MQYDGAGTKTHLAIKHMRTVSFTPANGARPGVPKVAIIISDGNSNEPHTVGTSVIDFRKLYELTMLQAVYVIHYIHLCSKTNSFGRVAVSSKHVGFIFL